MNRSVRIILGPVAATAVYLLLSGSSLSEEGRRTAAVAVLMGAWWVTEAIPLEVTGLVPLALFPVLGIARITDAATPYGNQVIFLFLSGMILGQAMERWGLHKRLAVGTINTFGAAPARLIAGFLVSTAFVSLWVSNLAASVLMAPIALSVARASATGEPRPPIAVPLLLAVAFGATIGGLGTLIGTPPTAQFAAFMSQTMQRPVTFLEWLRIGLPLQAVMLPGAWLVLALIAFRVRPQDTAAAATEVNHMRDSLGPWTFEQKVVAGVFIAAAMGWVATPLLAKWSALGGTSLQTILARISDTGVGVICALSLFLIPARSEKGHTVMSWRDAEKVHWGVLLLFGGGLSLADALSRHGVDAYLAAQVSPLKDMPLPLVLLVISLGAVLLTEFASNTALVAAGLPIALAMSEALAVPPTVMLVTVTLAASLGFMLPAGTPPNAVIFATRMVTMREMIRAGFYLDCIAALLVPLLVIACLKLGALPGM